MTFFSGYRNDGSYISNVLTTLLLVYLYYLSRWSVFQRTLICVRRASVSDTPERVRVSLSRLRVQRYGDFSEHANVFATFLKENRQNIDECQTTENDSRAYIFYIIIKKLHQMLKLESRFAVPFRVRFQHKRNTGRVRRRS